MSLSPRFLIGISAWAGDMDPPTFQRHGLLRMIISIELKAIRYMIDLNNRTIHGVLPQEIFMAGLTLLHLN